MHERRFDFAKPSLCVSPRPSVKDGLVIRYGDSGKKPIANDPIATLGRVLEDLLKKMAQPGATREVNAAQVH